MKIKYTDNRGSYTLVRFTSDTKSSDLQDLEYWCLRTLCGKRVNVDSFAFKEKDLIMFKLAWSAKCSSEE